jgi:hypothetical protein
MAIDNPLDIELRQLREQLDEDSYLPVLATKLGLSAAAAAALSAHPFVSQILTSLLTSSPKRFEQRFVSVMEALAKQQQQIEERIPDQSYYQSEEFHALLTLILEKLHSTHQQEKLKTFGEALANSGTQEFAPDDKEPYIRTLRDLSLEDLQTLRRMREMSQRPSPFGNGRVQKGDSASLARLASLGLLQESTALKDFDLRVPIVPTSSQTAEKYAKGMANAFKQYFKNAATTTYRISGFGHRFLSFIASASPEEQF